MPTLRHLLAQRRYYERHLRCAVLAAPAYALPDTT